MERILERYERYSCNEKQLISVDSETQGNWSLEYPKLKARIEVLQRNISQFMGEELSPLSLKELRNLEQQLDTALKRIRTRKNQLMHEAISGLQKQEKAMKVQNNMLADKIKENEATESVRLNQKSSFIFEPLTAHLPLPSLTIGRSSTSKIINQEAEPQTQHSTNGHIPPWMLRCANG